MTKSGRRYFNGLSIDNGFNSGGLDLGYQHELIVDKPKSKLTCMIPKLSHAPMSLACWAQLGDIYTLYFILQIWVGILSLASSKKWNSTIMGHVYWWSEPFIIDLIHFHEISLNFNSTEVCLSHRSIDRMIGCVTSSMNFDYLVGAPSFSILQIPSSLDDLNIFLYVYIF